MTRPHECGPRLASGKGWSGCGRRGPAGLVVRVVVRRGSWSSGARAGRVPLFEEFVQDLSDSVVDRVAEAGQELFLGPHGEDLSAGSGWAGCWWRLPALMPGVSGRGGAGGLHQMRSFRVL